MKNKEYFTKDLYEAAFLYADGQKLLRLQSEGSFYWFVFEDRDCDGMADSYWSGKGLISAKQYSDAIRSLKDRLFARR